KFSLRTYCRLEVIDVAVHKVAECQRVMTLRPQALDRVLVRPKEVIVLDVEDLATKLNLVIIESVAHVFIQLPHVLRPTKTGWRRCRVVRPLSRNLNTV